MPQRYPMWWKFTEPEAAVPAAAQWRMQAHTQGVSLSLWRDHAPVPYDRWLDMHPAARLLQQLDYTRTNAVSVHLSHESLASMQDYDAAHFGLPRHVPADLCITVNGRPESRRLEVDLAIMPFSHHRPWAQARIAHGLVYYDGGTYRLRPAQLMAVEAVQAVHDSQADLQARLVAYRSLHKLCRQVWQGGVQVQGYMPLLYVDAVQDFTLHTDTRGVCLLPGIRQPEPMLINGQSLATRWSDGWFSQEPLATVALGPAHHYYTISPQWMASLERVRMALRGYNDPVAARSVIMSILQAEQLRRVH